MDALQTYRQIYYPESRFGGFTHVDATINFYSRVHELLTPSSIILDVGCGRGWYAEDPVAIRRELRIFKGRCQKVIGIDVDPAAAANPYLNEFHQLTSDRWPIADESVDVIVSDWVLEHVAEPDKFFAEAQRVLKPGGYVCLRTTNARSYVGLISRLVPNRLHASVVSRIPGNKAPQDVFPATYQCNTRRALKKTLARHGFDGSVYGDEAEPYYLTFNRFAFWIGVLHQRFAPQAFRLALFAFGQKKEIK